MSWIKGVLLTVATVVIGLGLFALTGFYKSYPEAAPAPSWVMISVGAVLWVGSLFLISRIRDNN